MPKGIPRAGFRKTERYKGKSIQDIEKELAFRVPDIVAELEKLTKPMTCPGCGHVIKIIDKDVGMYLIDRVLGKPTQRVEAGITERIQLTGDDVDKLIEHYRIRHRALLSEGESDIIEGEVIDERQNSQEDKEIHEA